MHSTRLSLRNLITQLINAGLYSSVAFMNLTASDNRSAVCPCISPSSLNDFIRCCCYLSLSSWSWSPNPFILFKILVIHECKRAEVLTPKSDAMPATSLFCELVRRKLIGTNVSFFFFALIVSYLLMFKSYAIAAVKSANEPRLLPSPRTTSLALTSIKVAPLSSPLMSVEAAVADVL